MTICPLPIHRVAPIWIGSFYSARFHWDVVRLRSRTPRCVVLLPFLCCCCCWFCCCCCSNLQKRLMWDLLMSCGRSKAILYSQSRCLSSPVSACVCVKSKKRRMYNAMICKNSAVADKNAADPRHWPIGRPAPLFASAIMEINLTCRTRISSHIVYIYSVLSLRLQRVWEHLREYQVETPH